MSWHSPARRAPAPYRRDAAQEQAFAAELAPIDPKLPEQFAAATRLMDDGKTEEAASAFSKLAEAAPKHAPTLWRLSAMARVTGRRDDAIASARAAVAATDRWQAQSTLAEALMFGEPAGAISKKRRLWWASCAACTRARIPTCWPPSSPCSGMTSRP